MPKRTDIKSILIIGAGPIVIGQNHGFVVTRESLPAGVTETHKSLFDGTLEGLRVDGKPIFLVQHHPEASPGPQDSHYLFDRFVRMMEGG